MLPRLMLVSDRRTMRPDFLSATEAALKGGARLIQLREKDLLPSDLLTLSHEAVELCARHDATLLINSQPLVALKLGVSLHLSERFLGQNHNFEYSMFPFWGASVHSVEVAQRAEKLGAKYLVFGAVFSTSSHPGEIPAGVEKLREVVQSVSVPVFAIGGIGDEATIRACLDAGAHGVAVRSAVWDAPDVKGKVAELLSYIQ